MTNESAERTLEHPETALKLEEFLPHRLNVCSNIVSQALSRIYAERYKIGIPEWRVLVTLGQFGLMTAKGIGVHTCMHKTKVSRAVALLERRKLVARRANRADLREAFLSLTTAGRSAPATCNTGLARSSNTGPSGVWPARKAIASMRPRSWPISVQRTWPSPTGWA